MAIVRWEPFRDLLSLQERMNRMFGEYRGAAATADDDWALGGSWAPPVDIYEQGSDIVLKAELPGVDPKDVDIRLENNVLTLRGERKFENEVKKENYHRVERTYGTFSRSFTLPSVVNQTGIKADFKDGMLKVVLPKREEAKPKQIEISIAK
jgi:HSP20 family protein